MDYIVRLTGADLHTFLADMASCVEPTARHNSYLRLYHERVHTLTFAVDEGLKWKINGYSWSPARGDLIPTSVIDLPDAVRARHRIIDDTDLLMKMTHTPLTLSVVVDKQGRVYARLADARNNEIARVDL